MRNENEMIDYDDNIQSHEQFVELLIKLRKLTKYMEKLREFIILIMKLTIQI